MSEFGEITNADLARWQIRAYRVLGDILEAARREKLPVIEWTVNSCIRLHGRVRGLGVTPDVQVQTFEAWASWLGAELRWDATPPGMIHKVAILQDFRNSGTGVFLFADVYIDDANEAAHMTLLRSGCAEHR